MIFSSDTVLGGLIGPVITSLALVGVALINRKPRGLLIQEAANAAVQTALDGYKSYVETMTAAYKAQLTALTSEYEAKIQRMTASYEERISELTREIHALRRELAVLSTSRPSVPTEP